MCTVQLQTVKKRDLFRVKRDVELDEILFKRLNEEKFKRMSRREKRDTLEHVDTVMRSVHRQMSNIRVIYINLSIFKTQFLT